MKPLRWRLSRECPHCGSLAVRRSARKDLFEVLVLPLLLLRPFRCEDCDRRHYGFVFSGRSSTKPK